MINISQSDSLEFVQASTRMVQALVDHRRSLISKQARRVIRLACCRVIHIKQFNESERRLTAALRPLFSDQIQSAKEELESLDGKSVLPLAQKQADSARALVELIFRPAEWFDDLVDRALPVFARMMAEGAVSQMLAVGIDPRKSKAPSTKQVTSTASQWLADAGEELPPWIKTDLPQWMLNAIEVRLRESFSQDYWLRIAETTRDDIELFLREGLQEGQSIRTMASRISSRFPDAYDMRRATLVARTESGDSLNGGRRISMDRLQEEVGPQVPMQPEWLSVLGNTTRDNHASNDGVPADEDGMFLLSGLRIPWPGHFSLAPGDRCNCQCTVVMSFGMDEDDARQRIQDHAAGIIGEVQIARQD